MWSGPRNLSTAMMYSFAARPDFRVMDEPFYAPYLRATGTDHPMRDKILAAHETDPGTVALACLAPQDRPHLYMKHMPHHMVPGFPMEWATQCVHVHLIRHPARVIASYAAKWDDLTLDQIGFVQQSILFDRLGGVVLDSFDVRRDPEKALRGLCDAIDLPFDPAMLHWTAGPHSEDGIWAAHWYAAVHRTTGFAGMEGPVPDVDARHAVLLEQAMPHYSRMRDAALSF